MDFHDHRPYVPGDDVRRVDWNLFGRLGELHLKRFRDRGDVALRIVVDRSASMAVEDGVKAVQALRLAAAFAWGLAGEGVLVRVDVAEATGPRVLLRDRRAAVGPELLERLEALPPCAGRLPADDPFGLSDWRTPAGSARVAIVLSDLLDDAAAGLWARAAAARIALTALAIHAREERDPRPRGAARLVGAEGEGRLDADVSPAVVRRYRALFERRIDRLRERAAAHGARFVPVAAEAPFDRVARHAVRGEVAPS